jgi:glycosyltransferase involved in cell wall biosynthesis
VVILGATMRIIISTPYRENSIINIAAVAASENMLEGFYTTLYFARWQGVVGKIPVFGNRLAREFGRRSFDTIPGDMVFNVASSAELLRVATRRFIGNRWPRISSDLMYRVKSHFDNKVASKLSGSQDIVLVGMYGACASSFRAVKKQGGLAVLNFVNSHPVEHNYYLRELAGLSAPHHELIPSWVSDRVEDEISMADLILVPSRFVENQLLSHGVAREKIAMIPYGVDLHAFRPADAGEKRREILECLYVGQISHRKGVRDLLLAAARCINLPVHFRLIGPIVSSEVLNNMPENVTYEGATLPGGVSKAMRDADIFVLPTLEDSFALVVFEAMASGLPVITTSHAGSSEVITNSVDGMIIPPGNPEELAFAIQSLVEDETLRFRMGQAGRDRVLNSAPWEAYGNNVIQAVNSIC